MRRHARPERPGVGRASAGQGARRIREPGLGGHTRGASIRNKKDRSPLPGSERSKPLPARPAPDGVDSLQRAVITASLVIPARSMEAMAFATWP